VSLFSGRRWLRLVNVVDLEDYVEGVVGAEMPTSAPLEALKVQALIARTHALYLKSSRRRHRRDGYDLCDGDHCQVYSGVRVETARTRAAVAATRGEVLRYHGRLVQTLYSANCGGWTQSGTDVGWGQVPYWRRMDDSPRPGPPPDSPGSLRRYLTTWPDAYCRPSSLVYPSHSRWARVVPAAELGAKLDRRFRIGRLEGLRVLRRAPTGNVEALLVVGSRRRVKLTHEISIRSLLGVGSLRSTLFVVDPEYRRETVRARGRTRTRLVLDDFVFQGGGWGHAVGLCQSGAIGRAVAGQDAEEIVKAYFAGAELSPLPY
jgi:SpoIID/LytB domain protein